MTTTKLLAEVNLTQISSFIFGEGRSLKPATKRQKLVIFRVDRECLTVTQIINMPKHFLHIPKIIHWKSKNYFSLVSQWVKQMPPCLWTYEVMFNIGQCYTYMYIGLQHRERCIYFSRNMYKAYLKSFTFTVILQDTSYYMKTPYTCIHTYVHT